MRSSGEGRRGGGSGPWITAGHHSHVTFHLKKSRMSFPLLCQKKREKKTSSCTIVRVEMCLALRFLQLNTSKLANTGAAGIGTNQLGELSHASKNAALHTCGLNLRRLHTNGLVSWDGERTTELTPISLLLSVFLPRAAAQGSRAHRQQHGDPSRSASPQTCVP